MAGGGGGSRATGAMMLLLLASGGVGNAGCLWIGKTSYGSSTMANWLLEQQMFFVLLLNPVRWQAILCGRCYRDALVQLSQMFFAFYWKV